MPGRERVHQEVAIVVEGEPVCNGKLRILLWEGKSVITL